MTLRLDPFQGIKSLRFVEKGITLYVADYSSEVSKISIDKSYKITDVLTVAPDVGDYEACGIASDENHVFVVYNKDEQILIEKRSAEDLSLIDSVTTSDPSEYDPSIYVAIEEGSGVFFALRGGWCRVDKETLNVSHHEPSQFDIHDTYWVDSYNGKVYAIHAWYPEGDRALLVTEASSEDGEMENYQTYDFDWDSAPLWGIVAGPPGVYGIIGYSGGYYDDDDLYMLDYPGDYESINLDKADYPIGSGKDYIFWPDYDRVNVFDSNKNTVTDLEYIGIGRPVKKSGNTVLLYDGEKILVHKVTDEKGEIIGQDDMPEGKETDYPYDMDIVS